MILTSSLLLVVVRRCSSLLVVAKRKTLKNQRPHATQHKTKKFCVKIALSIPKDDCLLYIYQNPQISRENFTFPPIDCIQNRDFGKLLMSLKRNIFGKLLPLFLPAKSFDKNGNKLNRFVKSLWSYTF